MQYENLNTERTRETVGEIVLSICPTGVLESTVIAPSRLCSQRPLLALHGISRNAHELSRALAPVAEATGRLVVVPHFVQEQWPVYQRVTRRARPDKALLSLLATLRAMDTKFAGPVDIFGFSGGAQLAHRFAMLYPEAVGDLHLGAAGWYTFPDADVEYPYGVGDSTQRPGPWSRLMRSGLNHYLQRRFNVYVGDKDTHRGDALRQNPLVDAQQGSHRLERARRFVAAVNSHQAALGIPRTAELQILPDCDHSFSTCAARGDLAKRICATY